MIARRRRGAADRRRENIRKERAALNGYNPHLMHYVTQAFDFYDGASQ
jgi:hypothetical protein